MSEKQIKVTESLISDVLRFVVLVGEHWLPDNLHELRESIEKRIVEKIEAMERREAFTLYKTSAPGSEEREAQRKSYLEKAGINGNYISTRETEL